MDRCAIQMPIVLVLQIAIKLHTVSIGLRQHLSGTPSNAIDEHATGLRNAMVLVIFQELHPYFGLLLRGVSGILPRARVLVTKLSLNIFPTPIPCEQSE